MAIPLLAVGAAALGAYLVFGSKKTAATAVAPGSSPPGSSGGASPGGPALNTTTPSGTGTSTSDGSTPYVAPGDVGVFPDTGGGGGSTPIGPAAESTGTAPSDWTDMFSTSGPPLVYSPHAGGWVPYYYGHEHGAPPPRGLPIYR